MKPSRRLRILSLAAALGLALLCLPGSALAAPATVATGDAFIEKLAAAGVSEVTLSADIATSANLSVNKPVDLAGFTWTVSGGTVSVAATVTGGSIALTGSASLTVTGAVSGGVQVGANATLLRNTASMGTITGAGEVRVLSTVPNLAAAAAPTEQVQQIVYADGSFDLFSDATALAGSSFWLPGDASNNYALPKVVQSVTTDVGEYVLNASGAALLRVYTIDYELDGGAADPKAAANPASYTVEDSFTLSAPVRTGYVFAGWTGAGLTTPEASVRIPLGTTGNLAFTAHWTAVTGGGSTGGGSTGGAGFGGGSGAAASATAAETEENQESEAEAVAEAAPQSTQAAQSTQSASASSRLSRGKSGTRLRMTESAAQSVSTLQTAEQEQENFPFLLLAAGGLLAGGLALFAVLAKRRSDERMRRLMERMHIRDV